MTLSSSFTKKIKRGFSIRSSTYFHSEKPVQKLFRPTISLPLERPDSSSAVEQSSAIWIPAKVPPSPTSSSSSTHQSYSSSPSPSRSSSSSRTSYETGDGTHSPLEKKVSFSERVTFSDDTKVPQRKSASSSVYGPEGQLPPLIEDDEEISRKIGNSRFSAAEYIKEIEGTPMILVDGKLYL